MLSHHVKTTTENLLKLHKKTPEPFIFLISGTFPAAATLHIKQLSLFSMICRLPDNLLNTVGRHLLLSPGSSKTWFGQVEEICAKYNLPHPLTLLDDPPDKERFKSLVKEKVADYWQQFYRSRVADLPSLKFFKPEYCSLLRPHPVLSTASTPYEINKMIVQLRLLSGRGRLGTLLKHFSQSNNGICELCSLETEDLGHFLLPRCPPLLERAEVLLRYMENVFRDSSLCLSILQEVLIGRKVDADVWIQFVLDCSVIPTVIASSQVDSTVMALLFKATRTWCYSLHRTRLKLLGRWSSK